MNSETILKTVLAFGGAIIVHLFGGWSYLLAVLLTFVIFDYIIGFTASALEGKLSSAVGLRGIAKKVFIFAVVAIGHLIDGVVGTEIIMSACILFYVMNELLSIVENLGRVGVDIPPAITKAIEMLQSKSEVKDK